MIEKSFKKIQFLPVDSSLKNALIEFLSYYFNQKRVSPNTIVAYSIDLTEFINFAQIHTGQKLSIPVLQSLTSLDFRSYLSSLSQQNLEKTSIKRKFSALKSFFKYLQKQKIITESAVNSLKIYKNNQPLTKALSTTQALNAVKEAKSTSKKDWISKRNHCLLMLLYATGLRIHEALSLTVGSIVNNHNYLSKTACINPQNNNALESTVDSLNGYTIRIIGKGNKERVVPILPALHICLIDYLNSVPFTTFPDSPLFLGSKGTALSARSAQRLCTSLRSKLNLDDNFTPHTLRHSFATHLLKEGANIRVIQELLGHESLSATQRYLKISLSELQSAQLYHHPRIK